MGLDRPITLLTRFSSSFSHMCGPQMSPQHSIVYLIPNDMVDSRIRGYPPSRWRLWEVFGSNLTCLKRYMIVSFIETTDLTPKQYPNRINLSYLFPNRPNQSNQIGLCTIHVVLYIYYSTAWGPGLAPLAITLHHPSKTARPRAVRWKWPWMLPKVVAMQC